jgi:hypothetical protein
VDDLSSRTAQEVLDDHLNIANYWMGKPFETSLRRIYGAMSLKTLSSS